MKIRCTRLELLKASTPDWGTSPACEKLKVMLREVYAAPPPWRKSGMLPVGNKPDENKGDAKNTKERFVFGRMANLSQVRTPAI